MDSIWIYATLILLIILLVMIIYYIYYRINIKSITRQLEEILSIPDTNQLLTIEAPQRDAVKLANTLNDLIRSTRMSRIEIDRLNMAFRQSITDISHDLRTPLTTASGYIQMLQSGATEEESKQYLGIILERQNMVQLLLNQLFEYVRIQSGEITYQNEPVDARKIFVDTLTMYYDDFNRKCQEPRVNMPDSPCMICGDEQGLKRIFSNILFNALTHGGGDYCFEIKASDNYTFTFLNNSEPMSGDDLDNIFQRSYTLDQSRNRKTTGLGLAIAKEITKKLGGEIEASYNNGRFSISVTFPKV
jgi:signal transduction histidine kinase